MEVVVLKVKSLIGLDKNKEALKFLNKNSKKIIDAYQREELFGSIYEKLGTTAKAVEHYEILLELNSVNYESYYKILRTRGCELFDSEGKARKLDDAQK